MYLALEQVFRQIESELYALDAERAQYHPRSLAYKWTAQQVVEHLVLSYQATTKALNSRLSKGRLPRMKKPTLLQWSLKCMILGYGYLPQGAPAPDETLPAGHFAAMDGRQLSALLHDEISAMDHALDACRLQFGMERVAVHPWLGAMRIDQWRRFHAVHGLHHVAQLHSIVTEVLPALAGVPFVSGPLVEKLQIPVQRRLTQKHTV
jgi:hypothetical protein